MGAGMYHIRVVGELDSTKIRAELARLSKTKLMVGVGGGAGGGKGGKGNGIVQLGKDAEQTSKRLKGLNGQVIQNDKKLKGMHRGFASTSKEVEKSNSKLRAFGNESLNVTKKVVQFGAITAVIRGVTSGMGDMVQKTFELDAALTEFKKVSDLSGKGLDQYTDKAFKMGRSVAKTGTEMIEAATEFRKSGFNDQDSLKLGQVAMMFSNIADSELSAGDAAGFITSQIKANFNDVSNDATKASQQIIDAINEVSNTQAVSSTDLSMAMSKVGSAMKVNNNTYAQSLGMVTAGTEIMHGQASKVGRGLRTIGANISKMQKDAKTLDVQTKDGVKTIDLWDKKTNQVKSTYEVFKEFAGVWDDMTPDQQQALSLQMAGKNQQEVFASVIGNWKNAEKAAETAAKQIKEGGSAVKENAKYLESMQGHLENLKSAWSEFSNAMVSSDALKKGMDILAEGLRLLSTDAGQAIIKLAAVTAGANLLAKILLSLKGLSLVKLFKGFGNLGKGAKGLENVGKVAGKSAGGIGRLAGAFSKLSPFLTAGTLAGGILALSVALAKYVPIGEEAANIKIGKEWAGAKNDLDETIKKYQQLRDEREKLEKKQKKGTLTDSEANRLAILENQTDQLKRQVELKRELLASKTTEKWQTVSPKQLEGKQREKYIESKRAGKSDKEALAAAGAYNKLEVAMGKVEARSKATADAEQKMIEAYEQYGKDSPQYVKALENYTKAADKQGNSLEYLQKWHDKAVKEFGSEEKASKALGKSWTKLNTQIKGLKVLGGLDLKKPSEGLKKLGDYAKDAGVDMKTLKDGTVKVNKINLNKFSAAMQQAGWDTEQTWNYLKKLGEENPDMKVNIDGVDTAVKDLEFVDGKIKAVDKEKAEPKVEEKGAKETKKRVAAAKRELVGFPKSKSVKISESGSKNAKTKIGEVRSALAKLPRSKEIHITTYKTTVESAGKAIKKAAKSKGKKGHALGRKGTNTPSELSEVNERGFELIRDASTGQFRIAGGGKRTLTYLGEGDEVYTHAESLRMVRDDEDIMVPQFKKGKKGKKKKKKGKKKSKAKKAAEAKAKKVEAKRSAFEKELDTLEYKRDKNHWTDTQFNKEYTKLVDKYNKAIKKIDKTKNIGTEATREYQLSLSDTAHDVGTDLVESMIDNMYYDGKTNLTSIINKIDALKKAGSISSDEQIEFKKKAYESSIEYDLKAFENNKKTLEETRKAVKDAYDKQMISARQYYDYLEELAETQLEKEKERLTKQKEIEDNKYDLARTYVQYRIDLLEKENQEQEQQNELVEAQTKLAQARNKQIRIYKEGEGFVYEQDTEAIKEATESLKEYQKSGTTEELTKPWQDILNMMDMMDTVGQIKDLENKVGATVSELFDPMGTNLEQWSEWVSTIISTSLGLEDVIEKLDGISGYDAAIKELGDSLTVADSALVGAIQKNALVVGSNYMNAPVTTGITSGISSGSISTLNGNPLSITINGLTLPSVTDANSFINELQNLALQSSTTRG